MRKRTKSGRFTKGGRRRATLPRRRRVVRRRSSAPKIRYYSARPSTGVGRKVTRRRSVRTRSTASRIGAVVGAVVGAVAVGAVMGSAANEAGLLNKAPTQNTVGISATGLVGAGLCVVGFFVRSEGLKLLFYGLGGGLIVEELTRQIDMRFYDFRVAFGSAPALNYAEGISGAQVQLAALSSPVGALPLGTSAPAPASAAVSAPAAKVSNPAPAQGLPPTEGKLGLLLLQMTPADITNVQRKMIAGLPFVPALNQVFQERKLGVVIARGTSLETLNTADVNRISALIAQGFPSTEAVNQVLQSKGFPRLETSGLQQQADPSAAFRFALRCA